MLKRNRTRSVLTKLQETSWRGLMLVMLESAITAGMLCMPVMSPFFMSIGLSQEEIATSQGIFTVVTIFLNLPTGWLADRFSRKWANVIGDFGLAMVLLIYATAQSFYAVVVSEILVGVFTSLSKGVDMSLLRHFSNKIDSDEKLFRTQSATLALLQHITNLVLVLLGGPIGVISFRLAIALSSVPFWIGGVISLLIRDDSTKLKPAYRNPLLDMWRIAHLSLHDEPLRLRIMTYAVGREMTHAIIWVFTPMLIFVGVPLPIVSCAWALNSLACALGAELAVRRATKMKDWQIFAVPFALVMVSMGTLSLILNIVAIWLYLLMGIAQGWTSATLAVMVQKHARPDEQTSVLSFATTVGKLLYVPVIWMVGVAADMNLQYATLVMLTVFGMLGSFVLAGLLQE